MGSLVILGEPYLGWHFDLVRMTTFWRNPNFWRNLADLATTIISRSPLTTNLKDWNRIQTPSPPSTGISANSAPLHEVLCLYAEVLDFSHSTNNRTDAESWNHFLYTMHDLEKSNSSGFAIPLLSSPIGTTSFTKPIPIPQSRMIPTSFPVFIFTNRILFYNSFLSNITQMLLVQCKPHNTANSAAKSLKTTPWYAVQICGLSSSNPTLWSWDPLIVAALLFAGSFLSYSERQLELMEHSKVLRQMTGWMFEQEIQDLEEFWKTGCWIDRYIFCDEAYICATTLRLYKPILQDFTLFEILKIWLGLP